MDQQGSALTTDTVLQSRYRVLRPLGRGGMGAVYEAFDERLSRTVALKETLVETEELRRAFGREARLLANLRHPALPKVLDHFDEGSGLFLVMEFIPGDDLGRMLELGRAFAPAEVLRWAEQLLDALEYLHGLSPPVLHRDIKPANLKLVSGSQVVLLDFGLAKGSAGQMAGSGSTSLLAYSPNYSPLEQMQGAGTDERSDLYSLGATLYHLLTGVKPPDALTRATSVVNGRPDPLRPAHQLSPGVPASASAALMRAMALDLDNRPGSAAELRRLLREESPRAARTVPVGEPDEITRVGAQATRAVREARATGPSVERGRVVVTTPEETVVARRPAGGGRRWLAGALLLAGLAACSALLYLFFYGVQPNRPRQVNRPVARQSPTPAPTPVENVNRPANLAEPPPPSPGELAARAKLAEKNLAYNEAAFARVVAEGDTGAVELFLAAGMSPDVKDAAGRTALIAAAARGSNNVSQKLLGVGADVNARDNTGATPLMEAARGGHKETTEVLLRSRADVNLRDAGGRTALMRAAAGGHADIVRLLLERGARTDVKDRSGRDALALAQLNNNSDVVRLLRQARPASR